MIPPDNSPQSLLTKSRPGPLSAVSEKPHDDHLLPPPPYPGHASYQFVDESERAPKRFLKAFGVAILVYVVLASFTRTAVSGIHWGSGRRHSQIPAPRSSDGKTISCSSAHDGHFVVAPAVPVTTFLVPLSSDLLYIWGRGALSHGTINFLPSTDRSIPEGSVRVDITPHDYSPEALKSVTLCLLEPAANQSSIAILSPKMWSPADDIKFTVVVFFPVPSQKSAPLRVNAVETNLPLFTHVFSKLEGNVAFGSLKVYSANKPVHGDYVEAERATVVTSNARIDGKFRVSRSLDLQTSNQHIDAEVVLDHDPLTHRGASTNLSLHTSNALIHSKISLRTTSPFRIGGSFSVSASTRNGALDLSFPEQPVDSTLTLSARTSNSPATVRLHPAFEGQFELATANGHLAFAPNEGAEDPARRGRTRSWALTERTMKVRQGFVTWGSPGDPDPGRDLSLRGRVSVETLNDGVKLQV
ncbi:hypothetical protein V8D89_001083 [Ganoderma adspersum]